MLTFRYKMSRKYIRKCPHRKLCTNEQIEIAKKMMEEGKSLRSAAGVVGINESTLRRRLKTNTVASSLGRYKPTFSWEQEVSSCLFHFDQKFLEIYILF